MTRKSILRTDAAKKSLSGVKAFAKRNKKILELLLVTGVFFVAACFLTNGVILDINNKIFTGGIGDATSGFLWLIHANEGLNFFHEHTNLVNFPHGVDLWSPIFITWFLVMGPLWILSRFLSPVAALNIMTLIGFVSMGVAAYYFLKKILSDRSVSFIGAYAITFVPYHIMKSSDHLTNVFGWVFIAVIASFIAFWRNPSLKWCIALAASIAAACYTDGYFIFTTGVLLLALFVAGFFVDLVYGGNLRVLMKKSGKLLLAGIGAGILTLPIIFAQFGAQGEISKDLSNARENIKAEVGYYSAKPIDFLLPPSVNITVSHTDWYKDALAKKNSRSNDGENTNYIGYVVLALYATGLVIVARYLYLRMRKKDNQIKKPPLIDQTLLICLAAAPLVLIWMLPPVIHLFGIEVKMPIGYLTDFIAYWRVPARAFLVLHPLMVIAAMIVLYKLTRGLSRGRKYIILTLVLLLVIVEYFTGIKRPSFGLDRMPQTYTWLKEQSDIRSIAELPLVDRPVEIAGYYVFGQLIHGKPMVNTALAREDVGLFNPLGNEKNPETIDFLKARGVDAVILHKRECPSESWGNLVYSEYGAHVPEYIDKKATTVCVYKLNKGQPADSLFAYTQDGFLKTNYLNGDANYWVALERSGATIDVVNQFGEPIKAVEKAKITMNIGVIGEFAKKDLAWSVLQDGAVIAHGVAGAEGGRIEAIVNASKPVAFEVRGADGTGDIQKGEVGFNLIRLAPVIDL